MSLFQKALRRSACCCGCSLSAFIFDFAVDKFWGEKYKNKKSSLRIFPRDHQPLWWRGKKSYAKILPLELTYCTTSTYYVIAICIYHPSHKIPFEMGCIVILLPYIAKLQSGMNTHQLRHKSEWMHHRIGTQKGIDWIIELNWIESNQILFNHYIYVIEWPRIKEKNTMPNFWKNSRIQTALSIGTMD